MQVLLGLALPHGAYAVPLLDWSAGRILDIVATDDRRKRRAALSQLLTLDPALLLWTIAHHTEFESWSTLSARELSVRMSAKFESLLSEYSVVFPTQDVSHSDLHHRQIDAVNLARHTQQLADDHHAQQRETAYVLGLVSNADIWVFPMPHASDLPDRINEPLILPTWIHLFNQEVDARSPAIRGLARLVQTAKQNAATSPSLVSDIERKSWIAEFPLVRPLFPKLLKRITGARENQLDFQRRLEREKLDAMQQLAYGASHEINNPLTNISTRAQTLLHAETDPERRRQLATITSQAYRAHEMIADMMLFAKPPTPQKSEVDLVDFLRKTIASMREDKDLGFAQIEFSPEQESITVVIDPVQIDVAIRSIVKNSAESTSGTCQIWIRADEFSRLDEELLKSTVEISIQDNGQGISSELRKHVFDPFFSGREAGRGLGFGLSKAWRIVQEHGGEIVVSSEVGAGTTCTIYLPKR